MPAIDVEDLRVRRGGREVLHGISLAVEAGSVTGLVGPSACGKTTLIRSVVGTQVVEGGSVRVLGLAAGTPSLRRRVGYVTQSPSVYDDLTVTENLRYFAAILDVGRGRVARAIDAVGLSDAARGRVGRLSGGQRARVSLAVALLAQPDVLVLDEPTVGVDPVLRRDLWAMFRSLAEDGTTLLVTSHVMDEAERCSNLLLMRDRRVLAAGTPAELKERTDSPTVEAAFLRLVEGEPVSA